MKLGRLFYTLSLLISVSYGTLAAVPAQAREHEREHGHDFRRGWQEGRWVHDRHDGRLGWWWVIGSAWHFFPRPDYNPRTVVIEQPAQPQVTVVQTTPPQVVQSAPPAVAQAPVLYYCKATGTYYPETMTCPGGWLQSVAGTPPDIRAQP